MRKFYSILGALLMGATSLFAQTNYTVTFSANVEMEKVQVKNLSSGETKMLYSPDNVITLQKVEKQGTPIASVDNPMFLQQTANNEVIVNMEKAGHLSLTLYSLNGTFVARYSNNVDAGHNAFQIGASTGMYVLVATAGGKSASLKLSLTQNSQPGIYEIITSKSDVFLKSVEDVITFYEGDTFEFIGYYYSQTSKKTAVITSDQAITFSFTKATAPTVTTVQATDITYDAATVGGKVNKDNGAPVTERGICWNTTRNPTIEDNKETSGTGTGSFTATLSSLSDGTTFYARAYAINNEGTSYGDEITFTTMKIMAPSVSTLQATNVFIDVATIDGNVTADNGASVTERGICWATSLNPTIADNKEASGTGTGSFSVTLSSLLEGTTYYVRAYAINKEGTSYGNEITFTTKKKVAIVDGAIQSDFSVSRTKKVYFSQGNLQYQASPNKKWRFAENQWDFVGTQKPKLGKAGGTVGGSDNKKIGNVYTGWIDLFGWGTSGFGRTKPYESSTSSDYAKTATGSIAGTNYDWGVYNKISNGGNQEGLWRTLTYSEWDYLISGRAQASDLWGYGSVNNVNGIILLPDGWETPSSVKFTSGKELKYSTNVYTQDEWMVLQSYGAVFLPAAGRRCGTDVDRVGESGYYWSSTANTQLNGQPYYLGGNSVTSSGVSRADGFSVRLVQDVK